MRRPGRIDERSTNAAPTTTSAAEWKGAPTTKALDAGAARAPEPEVSPEPRPLPPVENAVAAACTELRLFRFQAVNASEVKGPFTVTLEDLTPVDGQPAPPRPVGEKGIVGHRIEKTVRLRIIVKDRDGNEPPHPVLLRLSAAGPRPGTLVLDPDGTRKECRQGLLVWHDRDAQGNLIPNDLLEYRLGTLSLLPGVEPDPENPGQVRPVWGVAEVLSIASEAITTEATAVNRQAIPVRPQPGKPHRLVDWDGSPTDDGWEWWNSFYTYVEAGRRTVHVTTHNAYSLVDKYQNLVWGYRDTVVRRAPVEMAVSLPFQDTTGPDFRAYALDVKWWALNGQMPVGYYPLELAVAYPADPDWPAGEVLGWTNVRLQGGNQTHLKSYGRYEARYGLDDGAFPMSVSPGAKEAAIPTVGPPDFGAVAGRTYESPRRLSLLLVTGSHAPSSQEVFRAPHHPWEWQGGGWVERPVVPAPDPYLDVSSKPRLRLKLVNVNGVVQTAAGFKVHFCPRFDHEANPAGPEWACPTAPVQSTNGVIEDLRMNPGVVGSGDPPSPDATGYLGLELTEAPIAPGTYYVYVESLDQDVKVRDQAVLLLDDTPQGQWQGGFALCTVISGEFLDTNLQRVQPFAVTAPTPVYVRVTDPTRTADSFVVDVNSYDGESVFDRSADVTLTRVGRSTVFFSEPLEVYPPGAESGGSSAFVRVTLATPKKKVTTARAVQKLEAIEKIPTRSLALGTTRNDGTQRFAVGLSVALTLYRASKAGNGEQYVFLADESMGPWPGEPWDPRAVTWSLTPAGATQEGPQQLVRKEIEPSPDQTQAQAHFRGIRISSGKGKTPATRITVTATAPDGQCASTELVVERPARLGSYVTKTVDWNGETIDLIKLIVDTADAYGMPPHYLAAQAFKESSFNVYAARYEASSRDFANLVGDDRRTAPGGVRQLTDPNKPYGGLSVSAGGTVSYLPCQEGGTLPTENEVPCIASETPPLVDMWSVSTNGILTDLQIPGLSGAKIQLGVDVRPQGASAPVLGQQFNTECDAAPADTAMYCVDPDAGIVRFGMAPSGQQEIRYRKVKIQSAVAPARNPGFPADPQEDFDLVRAKNGGNSWNVFPPLMSSSLRDWAKLPHQGGYFNANELGRYGRKFGGASLMNLIARDPSFGVQGQWFGATSYGVLQILPGDLNDKLGRPAVFSAADAAYIRTSVYDPMKDSPLKLFDPRLCVRLAVEWNTRTKVGAEIADTECPSPVTECTWRNVWSRRLCQFNTGDPAPCAYSNEILFGIDSPPPKKAPLVDLFIPALQ